LLHKSTVSMYKYPNKYIQLQLAKATKLCLSLNDDRNGNGALTVQNVKHKQR